MTAEMVSFLDSAENLITFAKDQGLDKQNAKSQKMFEQLTKDINGLRESSDAPVSFAKLRRAALYLTHTDKLGGKDPQIKSKATELYEAFNDSYAKIN
jgi:hypothetical protein